MPTPSLRPTLVLIALLMVACEPSAKPVVPLEALEVIKPSARLTALLPSSVESKPSTPPQTVSNFASLTVQDEGKDVPLTMDGLSVKVTIAGRMARTEVTQVFRNHTGRRTEGVYEFALPEGAAISRLAMDVNGVMTEGELVEKARARKIYDQIVASMKDPALLEWQGGNRFKTSIFPIEPRSNKTVVLTYEQLLPSTLGEVRYRYSMPNLTNEPDGTKIGAYSFKLEADAKAGPKVIGYDALKTAGGLEMKGEDFVPSGPVDIVLKDSTADARVLYAKDDDETFFVAELRPKLPKQTAAQARDLVIALDTSASIGQPELDRAKGLIEGLAANLSDTSRIQIVHGDQAVWDCFNRPAAKSEVEAVGRCLKPLDAAGGSDLSKLVGRAAELARGMKRQTSVVLISEGTASLGELDGDLIRATFAETVGDADINLHTVALGHTPNEDGLEQLALALGGHHTRLRPFEPVAGSVETIASLVREPLLRNLKVEVTQGSVDGLSPKQAINLAPGQSIAVLGKLETRSATLKLTGTYNRQTVEQVVELKAGQGTSHRVVRNFWARSSIGQQVEASVDRGNVVEFSKKYGVMSPYTSFLVLENDAAYKRFNVDRKKDRERKKAQAQAKATGNISKGEDSLQDLLAKPADNKDAAPEPAAKEQAFAEPEEDSDEESEPSPEMIAPPKPRAQGKKKAKRPSRRRADFSKSNRAFGGKIGDWERPGLSGARYRRKPPVDRKAQLAALEKRRAELTLNEQVTLLSLYMALGKTNKVKPAFTFLTGDFQGDELHERTRVLCSTTGLQDPLDDVWLPAARHHFRKTPGDRNASRPLFARHVRKAAWPAVVPEFGPYKLELGSATTLLQRLLTEKRDQEARSLFGAWRKNGRYTAAELQRIITNHNKVETAFRAELHAVLLDAVKAGDASEDGLDTLLRLGVQLKEPDASRKAVIDHCTSVRAKVSWCRIWFEDEKTSHPELGKIVSDAQPAWLAALRNQRATDVSNSALIQEMADMLEAMGHKEASLRLLSEMVEFTPHHYGRRVEYAKALAARDRVPEACRSYSVAVQLDPSKRDTFKTMMKLRRQKEKDAKTIKDCIVKGVSNLPVHRDVSLVLTWEDPAADVDLHIHEVGGEEVFYQHRTSKIGGFLYYDIIDGYGPEIYALGDGPKGEYRLTLVYYGGDAKNVKAKVTILKNAGSAKETRQILEFTLPESNTETQYPIGTFNL